MQSAFGEHGLKQPGWAVVLLIELSVLPLALRWSRPLAVLATTLAAAIVGDLWFAGFLLPGPVITVYTVAAHYERRVALAATAATGVSLVVPAAAGRAVREAGFVVGMYAVFAVAWALGASLRTRRAYLTEVEARAERLERDREESAAGGGRRAGADRAGVARCDLAQCERDGGAGGGREGCTCASSRAGPRGAGVHRVGRPRGAGRVAALARGCEFEEDADDAGFSPQPRMGEG